MILLAAIFGVLFMVTVLCVGFGQALLVSNQKKQISTMLRRAEPAPSKRLVKLMKADETSDPFTTALTAYKIFARLSLFIEQSGTGWNVGKFVICTLIAGFAGAAIGYVIPPFSLNPFSPLLLFCVLAGAPFLILKRKRTKRLAAFEEQLPEALNFLSRSMRAGHGFSIGLEMLVADSPEPLGYCFRQVLNDLHLGSSFESALGKLTVLAPLIDVRFFVSSVILQQGTGGNLGEILDSMAQIIRERFQLKGQVKAASAHGRITGLILALMPVIVAALMFFISPDYLFVLFKDPDGKKLVLAACCGQIVGYFCIRKITNFKV
jgi:tight adherence protein B